MNYEALYDRILRRVDDQAYLALADAVPAAQADAMAEIEALMGRPDFDPATVRSHAHRLASDGRIDRVLLYSALHVIAASPRVKDYAEAASMVAQQELAALQAGGPRLSVHLASVDRHRGVLAFLIGSYDVALDYFSRAFERQRSAGNLANVLAALIRLGDADEARKLHARVCAALPVELVASLDDMIRRDPDLSLLRSEAS